MPEDKKKTTALTTSVGADDGQSIPGNTNIIADKDGDYNPVERDYEELLRKMNRRAAPDYLHTVTMSELYRNVYTGRAPIIDGLLCSGAYILAGAPKIGKSFLVAQIAYHVSTGEPLWDYTVRQGTLSKSSSPPSPSSRMGVIFWKSLPPKGGEDRQFHVRSDGDRAVVLQNKGPPASHSGGCRSSRIPPFPLGERNALLMALLSKVLLRYF